MHEWDHAVMKASSTARMLERSASPTARKEGIESRHIFGRGRSPSRACGFARDLVQRLPVGHRSVRHPIFSDARRDRIVPRRTSLLPLPTTWWHRITSMIWCTLPLDK
eukprot:scaffold1800_cov332-Pavlova_lutheri.AAC.11